MNSHDFELAVLKNKATNARLFSGLMALINLVAFHNGYGQIYALYAITFAITIGLAVIADQIRHERAAGIAALAVYCLSAGATLFSIASLWG